MSLRGGCIFNVKNAPTSSNSSGIMLLGGDTIPAREITSQKEPEAYSAVDIQIKGT